MRPPRAFTNLATKEPQDRIIPRPDQFQLSLARAPRICLTNLQRCASVGPKIRRWQSFLECQNWNKRIYRRSGQLNQYRLGSSKIESEFWISGVLNRFFGAAQFS